MKVGDRVMLISVPECSQNDINRCGVIIKIGGNTINGRNVDILLDGDDGLSAVFDHQLKILNYKTDPKLKLFNVTEETLKENEIEGGCFDSWCSILEYDDKYAVDLNYYIDGYDGETEENSHFYGCFPNEDGDIVINCDCYSESFEIDFKNSKWKEKLFQKAYEFLITRILSKEGEN